MYEGKIDLFIKYVIVTHFLFGQLIMLRRFL